MFAKNKVFLYIWLNDKLNYCFMPSKKEKKVIFFMEFGEKLNGFLRALFIGSVCL